jgi:hypothetical protein
MAGLGFDVVFEALFPAKPSACQVSPTGLTGRKMAAARNRWSFSSPVPLLYDFKHPMGRRCAIQRNTSSKPTPES